MSETVIVRPVVSEFASAMEKQLQANEHKGSWEHLSNHHLMSEMHKNMHKLYTCVSHSEYRRRCANIANFAMMLADNDRREEAARETKSTVVVGGAVDHIKEHIIATGDHDEC